MLTRIAEGWWVVWDTPIGMALFFLLPAGLLVSTYIAMKLKFQGKGRLSDAVFLSLIPYAAVWMFTCLGQYAERMPAQQGDYAHGLLCCVFFTAGPVIGWLVAKRTLRISYMEAGKFSLIWAVSNTAMTALILFALPTY